MDIDAQISDRLRPADHEAAVLSLLLVADSESWVVAAGSLLTGSTEMASTSWRRWRELQPRARQVHGRHGFDIGPSFYADPFPGVRILRQVVEPADWEAVVTGIGEGMIAAPFGPCVLRRSNDFSPVAIVGRNQGIDSHRIVSGVMRPVSATFARLEVSGLPATDSTWSLEVPYYLPRGPDRGRMVRERDLLYWPEELLGIDWLGGSQTPLPETFAIGRVHESAWIADLDVDYDSDALHISIAWDADRVDPYSCSLAVRAERDGGLLVSRQIKISDLPTDDEEVPDPEPRSFPWNQKLLGIRLPRGPRSSDWGVILVGPDGAVLDEHPVARRIERIDVSIGTRDSPEPFSEFTIGDSRPTATRTEADEAVAMVAQLEREAKRAAAQRRITSGPALATYLRQRFSCRAGELLVLDPFFFNAGRQELASFLAEFDRRMRVLTSEIRPPIARFLDRTPWLEARPLPNGVGDVHDRVWMVGETALLVGNSVAALLSQKAERTTSASELPAGDAVFWRERFELWWSASGGAGTS